jgi:Arc/MetJ-type ribon-helix-helix transcriptional regulator
MKKTSVYLSEEEADGLRALSRATGRSQAELIREGIRRMLRGKSSKRRFHSMGFGAGDGSGARSWSPEELAQRRLGQRRTG